MGNTPVDIYFPYAPNNLLPDDFHLVTDGPYSRIHNRVDNEVGILFGVPMRIRVYDLKDKLIRLIEDSCIKNGIFYLASEGNDGVDIFPYIPPTKEFAQLLDIPIEIKGGIATVVQGEYAVSTQSVIRLATYGIAEDACRGVLMFDPTTQISAIAHIDLDGYDIAILERMKKDMIDAGAASDKIVLHLHANFDPQKIEHLLPRMGFADTIVDLKSSFAFNPSSGQIEDFDMEKHIRNRPETELDRMGKLTNLRIQYQFPIYPKQIAST